MTLPEVVYDVHTHIFPERLAERAVENIGGYYGIKMEGKGTAKNLEKSLEAIPQFRFVISSAALKAEAMVQVNDYLLEEAKENNCFIPFSSVYPHIPVSDAEKELVRVKEKGTMGIKLHPDFQKFYIDDSHVFEIYKICRQLDLPVLIHLGDENTDYSTPTRLYNVVNRLPDLKVIAAHLGGYTAWDEAERVLLGANVYTETSDAWLGLEGERIVELCRKHGIDKVMFGSDYPLAPPEEVLEKFDALPFTKEEKEKIYQKNAERLFFNKN